MHFSAHLEHSTQLINEASEQILKDWLHEADQQSNAQLTRLLELFKGSVGGGKGMRGALVQIGYDLSGAPASTYIIRPAVATEILHTAMLIHDDIIDKSLSRRGKPTLHQAVGDDHYAVSQAICLADIGFFLAVRLVAESEFAPEAKTKALQHLSHTIMHTGLGQMLDVKLSQPDEPKREQDVVAIQKLKTAEYSVIGPLSLGATLGGANATLLAAIERFGDLLGQAYQIQDDILGVYGDEKTVGKSVTSDIEENKNTLLVAYSLEHGTSAHKAVLTACYGKGAITSQQHEQIKQVFQDSGALGYAESQAKSFVAQASAIIPELTQNKELQTILQEFTDFIVQRRK